MPGRVNNRTQRRGHWMDRDWCRRYHRRQRILQTQLAILEENREPGVRRRAHMMCREMTDLSPDSTRSAGPEIEEEKNPKTRV